MDDNATSNRAGVVTANIIIEDWPARSRDLNVIGHAWDMLQRAVNAGEPAPNSLVEHCIAVQEAEWTTAR